MPKVTSDKCNKKMPKGAHLVKKAFPETSPRLGYFVDGGAPVVKYTRGSAKGCVRSARAFESKRIRQANRAENRRSAALPKKASPKKASPKKTTPKKASPKKTTPKKTTPKKATPKKATPKKTTPKKATPKKTTPKKTTPKKTTPKKTTPKKKKTTPKKTKASAIKAKAKYVILNQDFALANMNKTVLTYFFEVNSKSEYKKTKGDRGSYYKIIGFTTDKNYAMDFEPEAGHHNLKLIPQDWQDFIVLQKQGTDDLTIINHDGDAGILSWDSERAYVDVNAPVKVKTVRAKYVLLNQDFAVANINRTVLCFVFDNGKKIDEGKYYKIIGFTNNEYYDLDFVPEVGYQNISLIPQQYIVLHEQGNNNLYPIVIENNGNADGSGHYFFVDTTNKRPEYVPLNAEFARAHMGESMYVYNFVKVGNMWNGTNQAPGNFVIEGFTDDVINSFDDADLANLTNEPRELIVLRLQGNPNPMFITKTGETINKQYRFFVSNPVF